MSRKTRISKVDKQAGGVATSVRQEKPQTRQLSPPSFSRTMILVGLLVLTFAAFSNTLFHGFAYDDTTQILQNELIRDWKNVPDALTKEVWFWRVLQDKDPTKTEGPTTPYYRPVFMVYLMLGWHLFGTWAFGWHLLSVLMHLIGVYFVFLILEKITGDLRLTGVATLLFAIHPLRSESVAWISGSTDLFLAVFLLPSFYYYLRYREAAKRRDLAISLLFFLFAAFSKEPAVALPIFIAAYEVFFIHRDKPLKERLIPAAEFASIFFMVTVIYFFMRYHALGFILSDKNYKSYPLPYVLMTIPLAITKYIGLLLFPLNLSIFHYTEMVKSPLSYRFFLPLIVVAALSYGVWRLRKSRLALFGALWFAVNLLPVLNLNALAEDFLIQERYVYIPSLGFSLLLALAILSIPFEQWFSFGRRRTVQVAVVALLAVLFTGKTLAQNMIWKDDNTLWVRGQESAPDEMMPNYILGHQYIRKQQPAKVVEMLEQYMTLNPTNIIVISNLAAAHLQLYELTLDRSHVDRAIALCEQGLKLDEEIAPLWDTLGHAYVYDTEIKNYPRARAFFAKALEIQPDLLLANFHIGATYVKEGQLDEGIRYLEYARSQRLEFPDTHKFLGVAYATKGETQKAIDSFVLYLTYQPNAMDAAKVRQDIATLRNKLQTAQAATTPSPPTQSAGQLPIGQAAPPR